MPIVLPYPGLDMHFSPAHSNSRGDAVRPISLVIVATFSCLTVLAAGKPKLLKSLTYARGATWTSWRPYFAVEYAYAPSDSLLKSTVLEWDTLRGQWDTASRDEYAWTADSREVVRTWSRLDTNTHTLAPSGKYARKYDSQGRLREELESEFKDSAWTLVRRVSHSFDAAGDRTRYFAESWDKLSSAFIPYRRDTLIYDSRNRLIETRTAERTFADTNWIEYQKDLSAYDSLDRNTTQSHYVWKPDSSQWFLQSKDTLGYNAENQHIRTYSSRWPKGPNWYDSRDTLIYDSFGNVIRTEGWFLTPGDSIWYGGGGTWYREVAYAPWGGMIAYERWSRSGAFSWGPEAKEVLTYEGTVSSPGRTPRPSPAVPTTHVARVGYDAIGRSLEHPDRPSHVKRAASMTPFFRFFPK
jgi:hypothetical protein